MNVTATLNLTSLDIETAGLNFMQCHRWLEDARHATADTNLHALIDDVMGELWEIGSVEGELGDLVIGVLESVAAAIEISSFLQLID